MRPPRTLALLLATTIAPVPAQEKPEPKPLDPGPLLTFVTLEGEAPNLEGRFHVAELEDSRIFTFAYGRRGPRVLARLDRNHLLLERLDPDALLVLAPASGSERVLCPGPTAFVAKRGDEVLFLRGRGKENLLSTIPWGRDGEPRTITEQALVYVPIVKGNLAFGIDEARTGVYRINLRTGDTMEIWRAPERSFSLVLAISPGGQHLAASCIAPDGKGVVRVFDVATGEERHAFDGIPVWQSPLSSMLPSLPIFFCADDRLAYAEFPGPPRSSTGEPIPVIREIHTGRILDEEEHPDDYDELSLPWLRPPDDFPSRFVIERTEKKSILREVGRAGVLAEVHRSREQFEDLERCPIDPRFATARTGVGKRTLRLFVADQAKPRRLADHWAHQLQWWPAAR